MRPASYDLTQHPAICAVEIERGEMKGGEKPAQKHEIKENRDTVRNTNQQL